MKRRPFIREGIAGALTAAFGSAILIGSLEIPTVFGFNYGPGFFPSLIGIGLVAAGAVQLAASALSAPVSPMQPPVEQSDVAANRLRPIAVLFLTLAFTWIMSRVGFHLTAPIALFLLFGLFRVPWRFAILLAVGLTFVMDAIFRALLLVPLPWGILTPWTGVLAWRF